MRVCKWCQQPASGTALERVRTPAGWSMEFGGRSASCGTHGVGYFDWTKTEREAGR